MPADLHLHTTCSDGRRTPDELVVAACRAGLAAIALTDHDTTAGLAAAQAAVQERGLRLEIVTGIELSSGWEGTEVHVLGYGFAPDTPDLVAALGRQRAERERRMDAFTERLRAQGLAVTRSQVETEAAGAILGRPHLARALVRTGAVGSEQEAFDRYLSPGCPTFVPRRLMTPKEAIALIHQAGGVASLAHPRTVGFGEGPLCDHLVGAGLDAIEVVHPSQPAVLRDHYRQLAARHGWLLTGGSDDHGPRPGQPERLGHEAIPMAWVEALGRRRSG